MIPTSFPSQFNFTLGCDLKQVLHDILCEATETLFLFSN